MRYEHWCSFLSFFWLIPQSKENLKPSPSGDIRLLRCHYIMVWCHSVVMWLLCDVIVTMSLCDDVTIVWCYRWRSMARTPISRSKTVVPCFYSIKQINLLPISWTSDLQSSLSPEPPARSRNTHFMFFTLHLSKSGHLYTPVKHVIITPAYLDKGKRCGLAWRCSLGVYISDTAHVCCPWDNNTVIS